MKHEAIYKLYPNAVRIDENNNVFKAYDNKGNLITIDINSIETKVNELKQLEIDKENTKASAKSKLQALGLTTEEIKALIGQ